MGDQEGDLLVLGWGSTFGSILTAVQRARSAGLSVSSAHIRHLNPFPENLGDILARFRQVLIPELNLGQLRMLIRSRYLIDAQGLNRVTGRPFKTIEIETKIKELVGQEVPVG
jgi:2-oxoglutarate ferredoxin oxidoreductase subunit alpha